MKKTIWTLCMMCVFVLGISLVFTGCGNQNRNDTTDMTTEENAAGNVSSATEDDSLADDVGEAADDLADGAEDAVDDVANGFDSYDDAHDYLLNKLSTDNSDGQYEVRNEKKDVTEYKDGAKGYHFEIYDTSDSSGKKFGDFYVDKENGKIYKKDTKTKKIEEYK